MKNIVITGSTRGLGLSLAKEFLRAGCTVTISGRGELLKEEIVQQIARYSGKYDYVPCDVRKCEDIENLWTEAARKWGRVDVWINNAGQNSVHDFIHDTANCYVDNVIDTNLKGMIFGSKIAAKNMLLQGGGQIFNMEGLGSNNMIQLRTVLYGTTKHALTYFTRGMAKELEGTKVFVSRLSPGMMLTEFITKTPTGEASPVLTMKAFRGIFNILADTPQTVAQFFVPRILQNKKNNAHIVWLTNTKTMKRFILSPFIKRRLI